MLIPAYSQQKVSSTHTGLGEAVQFAQDGTETAHQQERDPRRCAKRERKVLMSVSEELEKKAERGERGPREAVPRSRVESQW